MLTRHHSRFGSKGNSPLLHSFSLTFLRALEPNRMEPEGRLTHLSHSFLAFLSPPLLCFHTISRFILLPLDGSINQSIIRPLIVRITRLSTSQPRLVLNPFTYHVPSLTRPVYLCTLGAHDTFDTDALSFVHSDEPDSGS